MKHILTLTEYNLRSIRRPLLWMLLLMGPAQLLLSLLPTILNGGGSYEPPYMLFRYGMFVPAGCMIAAALLNFFSVLRQNGRSKAIYTLMTLPGSRSQIFFSQVLSGVIAVLAVVAAQALWYMLLYLPTGLLNNFLTDRYMYKIAGGQVAGLPDRTSLFLHNGLFLSMMRARAMRILMPTSLRGILSLLLCILCPTVCLLAIPCRRGLFRVLMCVLFAASVFITLMTLLFCYMYIGSTTPTYVHNNLLATLVVLAAVSGINALYGLDRAKNL